MRSLLSLLTKTPQVIERIRGRIFCEQEDVRTGYYAREDVLLKLVHLADSDVPLGFCLERDFVGSVREDTNFVVA